MSDVGVTITFVPHPDGSPLHWLMTTTCPHGTIADQYTVGRESVLWSSAQALVLNHRLSTRCSCALERLTLTAPL